jgi:outer membrane protein TolC
LQSINIHTEMESGGMRNGAKKIAAFSRWSSKYGLVRVLTLIILIGVLSQGCITVGPDYLPPEPIMPDAWHQDLTRDLTEGEANLKTWWKTFNEPILDSLIERASTGNLDLKEAAARIMEARALRGIAAGERVPDVDGTGVVERSRTSEDFSPPTGERTDYIYSLGTDSSWEIDFWGRVRRLVESADAGLEASVEAYRDVQVLLFAEIALNYVEVRTLQARINFAESNVKTQRDSLEITEARLKAEIIGELDVRQAELNLARTESSIPVLRSSMKQAINRLGVLLGEFPSALYDELTTSVPIPIRQAERELAAQTAQIGVATSELYPRFFLFGDFGFEGTSDIFDYDKRGWSFGPTFRWNIFDGGRVRNFIRAEDARTEQALVRYERTVLNALEEVENSMISYAEESKRRWKQHENR